MTETLQHVHNLETSLAQVGYAEATFLTDKYDVATLATIRSDQLIPAERQQAGLDYLRTAVQYDANYGSHPADTLEMLIRNKYALAVDSARAYAITDSYLRAISEDSVTTAHTQALRSIRPGLTGRSPLLQSAVAKAWDGLAGAAVNPETSHRTAGYKQVITSLDPPREPLREQLLAAVDVIRKIDTTKALSPIEDLNPLCELTEKLAQNTTGFEPEDIELHAKVTGAIVQRVNGTAPHDSSRRLYKNVLVAMGGEVDDPAESAPAQKAQPAPITEPEIRRPKAVADAPKPLQKEAANHPEKAAEVTVSWGRRQIGAAAALAAVIISPIAEATAAYASPAPAAGSKTVARAPSAPGTSEASTTIAVGPPAATPSDADTAILPKSAIATPLPVPDQRGNDINVIPNAHPGESGPAELLPNAHPGQSGRAEILQGAHPGQGGQAENVPTAPGANIVVTDPDTQQPPAYTPPAETTGTSGGTMVNNPNTVIISNDGTTAPGTGQNVLVVPGSTPGAPDPIPGGQNAAPPSTQKGTGSAGTAPAASSVTVSVPGSATTDSPKVVIEPANPQPTTEQSDQDMLEFYLQNGSSSDVIQQYGQILADKYQLTTVKDSDFLNMVNTTISQLDTGQADMNLVLAGIFAKMPAARAVLDTSPSATADSPFVTLIASQGLGSTDQGLAGLDGQQNYTDDDKTAIYTLLARGLADKTSSTEQNQILESMGISGVSVITPPPASTPTPPTAPKPQPKASAPSEPQTPTNSPEKATTYTLTPLQLKEIDALDIPESHKAFLRRIIPIVMNGVLKGYHINPDAVIAQAINESGWGTSTIAQEGNNLFGAKGDYHGKSIDANGTEQNPDGSWTGPQSMQWKDFPSLTAALADYAAEIGNLDWYDDATHCNQTPKTYLQALESKLSITSCHVIGSEAAWATDQSYVGKTMNYVTSLKLTHILKIGQPYKLMSVGHPATSGGTAPPEHTPATKKSGAKQQTIASIHAKLAKEAKAVLDSAEYSQVMQKLEQGIPGYNPDNYSGGKDCAFEVGSLVRFLSIDANFPFANTVAQYNYMTGTGADKWQRIKNMGNISNLKPGDVFSIGRSHGYGGDGHTFIYVGGGKVVASSMGDHGPELEDVYFHDDRNSGSGNNIDIFRYVG